MRSSPSSTKPPPVLSKSCTEWLSSMCRLGVMLSSILAHSTQANSNRFSSSSKTARVIMPRFVNSREKIPSRSWNMVPCTSQCLTSSRIFTSVFFFSSFKPYLTSIFALADMCFDLCAYVPALRHHDSKCNSLHGKKNQSSLLGPRPLTESNLLLTYPSFHVWLG